MIHTEAEVDKETVEVMYNKCFGGFQVSPEAAEKYIYTKKILGYDMSNIETYSLARGIERTDEIMIKIVKELGEKANCKYSKIEIKSFPYKYKKYVEIDEYDGYEEAYVNMEVYKLESIRAICFDFKELNHEDKLNKIKEVLEE